MNHQSPPNWVKERADCNIDLSFESLHEIVKCDVESFNKLHEDQRRGQTFRCDYNDEGHRPKFSVLHDSGSKDAPQVRFVKESSYISVNGSGVQLNIRSEWDGQRCRWRLKGHDTTNELVELWEVSQKALTAIFFEDPA